MTDSYGISIASNSMVTEMAEDKSIGGAQKIAQRDVLDILGGLLDESKHCALRATDTLEAAIRDYVATKREPWKRACCKY
jgi:NifU-like protein involved in Fe-S cluster formation